MKRTSIVSEICTIADGLGEVANGSEWYLFGSVDRDEAEASDVDLIILCRNDEQADIIRNSINHEAMMIPVDLSILTYEKEFEIKAVSLQNATKII